MGGPGESGELGETGELGDKGTSQQEVGEEDNWGLVVFGSSSCPTSAFFIRI